MFRLSRSVVVLLLALASGACRAQQQPPAERKIDIAVLYTAEHTLKANTTQSVWLQGGSVQLGAEFYHGLGLAADLTGLHTGSIGNSGVPFSEVTATFGPRYRWHTGKRTSVYGQVLFGEANAFDSIVPGAAAAQTGTNSLALKVGGGLDYSRSSRIAFRLLDASWMKTQISNSTNNLQNDVRLSAGIVFKLGR